MQEQPTTEFDIWADENEPVVTPAWTTYRVALPDKVRSKMKWNTQPVVCVQVDEWGMVTLDAAHTHWFGDRLTHVDASKSVYQLTKEIWEWLVEWEFVRWINIGPEDRELFALKKLTGEDYEYEHTT